MFPPYEHRLLFLSLLPSSLLSFLCCSRKALASEGLSPDLDELLTSALAALRRTQAGYDVSGASLKSRLARLGARWPVPNSQWPLAPGSIVVVAREGLSFGLQGTVLGQASNSRHNNEADEAGERVVMVRVGVEPVALARREIAVWDTGEGDDDDRRDSWGTTTSSSGISRAYSNVYPGGLSAEVSRRLAAEAQARSPQLSISTGGTSGGSGDSASKAKSSAARKLARGLKRKAAKKGNGSAK